MKLYSLEAVQHFGIVTEQLLPFDAPVRKTVVLYATRNRSTPLTQQHVPVPNASQRTPVDDLTSVFLIYLSEAPTVRALVIGAVEADKAQR
jgi:hypothetical protein